MLTAQEPVYARDVLENTHVVGHHDSEVCAFRKRFAKIVTMSLNGHGNRRGIQPIRTISDAPTPSSSPERQHLPEGVEQQVQVLIVQMPGKNLRISIRNRARQPFVQSFGSLASRVTV